jgi:FkbM family methyltransferase
MYVGCNKAMDAVNTLRMISGDGTYDRTQWRDLLFEGHSFEGGRCGQDESEQFQIDDVAQTKQNTIVHCIEAMPVTAKKLKQTVQALGWQNNLVVSNVAMSDTDGTVLFPNVVGKAGVEDRGIENCQGKKASRTYQPIPLYRLDTFVERNLPNDNNSLFDFLSIDVEGFDFAVLMGGPQLLQRTKYIEFEYNWKGQWKDHKLSTAIDMLKDTGFVCYWAGAYGHIWRITDCW